MSFVAKILPFIVVAAAVSACSDVTSPTQSLAVPASSLASKGGTGGGGGGGGGGATSPVVTKPTVNVTGTFVGTTDGPDVVHTYTFSLTQASDGSVTGIASYSTATQNGFFVVAGTVSGDSLTLFDGPGTVAPGEQLVLFFTGKASSDGSQIVGNFVPAGGKPITLVKQ
jgi:hypothetical protein